MQNREGTGRSNTGHEIEKDVELVGNGVAQQTIKEPEPPRDKPKRAAKVNDQMAGTIMDNPPDSP